MRKDEDSRRISDRLETRGVSRRDFLKVCTIAAASVGLPSWCVGRLAEAAETNKRPSVIWLHFQECTGCSETLLRTSHPAISELILDLISLDYHETLFAASGVQAEKALHDAINKNVGRYICIVEGAVPLKDNGVYCKIGGRTAFDILNDVGEKAGAVIAIGSCASWGGIPSAEPNPTGATGVPQILPWKQVVTLPGCPANPYNLLGTVLQYSAFGTLPVMDELGRPRFAYGRTIHEDCSRRSHFDAGRFAETFGDESHREGHCLYKIGCKGPATHANCSLQPFCEIPGAWPVGIGHPCVGCTEQAIAFHMPLHATVEIDHPTPPDTYPPVHPDHSNVSTTAVGFAGLVGGALLGAGVMMGKKLGEGDKKEEDK
ncbi:MAG: hydrogenase small subunit [Candidatus Deferrimicrobiaceae bacterium]